MTGPGESDRLSAVLEHAQDIIIVIDDEGTIQYVNPAIERILGYPPEERIGENAFEFMHPDDQAEVFDRFSELLDRPGAATDRIRHRLEHADGGWRWFESVGSNHTDEALDGYVINSRDITDRRQQEREIARQRALLEAQQESVLDGLLVVDEAGDIISSNDRFVELWEIPPEIMDGGADEEALDYVMSQVANPAEFRENVEYLYEHESETSQDEIELADGRVFDRYTAPLTGEDGTYYGRLWTFRDITDRKRRESELQRQNDRLEEFASIVSHDLRNPLNVATARLELGREQHDDEHLEAVARAHDRIETLIDDLLTLARTGEQVGELDRVEIGAFAETCWRSVETGEATLLTDVDLEIDADRSRLRQLLENLIRNAVEHGSTNPPSQAQEDAVEHSGDEVTVTVGGLPDGFYVEDDGPGIPPDTHEDLFDAGYTTTAGGTGFGLSIVKQVAAAHGWDVAVTDGTDGGARFEITGIEGTEA